MEYQQVENAENVGIEGGKNCSPHNCAPCKDVTNVARQNLPNMPGTKCDPKSSQAVGVEEEIVADEKSNPEHKVAAEHIRQLLWSHPGHNRRKAANKSSKDPEALEESRHICHQYQPGIEAVLGVFQALLVHDKLVADLLAAHLPKVVHHADHHLQVVRGSGVILRSPGCRVDASLLLVLTHVYPIPTVDHHLYLSNLADAEDKDPDEVGGEDLVDRLNHRSNPRGRLGVGDQHHRPAFPVSLVGEREEAVVDGQKPPHPVLFPVAQLKLGGAGPVDGVELGSEPSEGVQ